MKTTKKFKKYVLTSAVSILFLLTSVGCGQQSQQNPIVQNNLNQQNNENQNNEKKYAAELNLLTWADYMPQTVLDKFEEKYGIKVNYIPMSDEQEVFDKIKKEPGAVDIATVTPSNLNLLKTEKNAEKIDFNNVPNFKFVKEEFKEKKYDPTNEYSVPYVGGTTVLLVDTNKVKEPIKGYKDLWNSKYKKSIVLLNFREDVIIATLKKLGYSINETDSKKYQQVLDELRKLRANIKAFDNNSPSLRVVSGEVPIAMDWSGSSKYLVNKPNIKIIFPEEGGQFWVDYLAIPKGAKHKKEAELFFNFLLEPQISAEIAKTLHYSSPNGEAYKLIDERDFRTSILPDSYLKKLERYRDVEKTDKLYDNIWNEIQTWSEAKQPE